MAFLAVVAVVVVVLGDERRGIFGSLVESRFVTDSLNSLTHARLAY